MCSPKYKFSVTQHHPRARAPVSLRASSSPPCRCRHEQPTRDELRLLEKDNKGRQESQVDGANEHQSRRATYRQLHRKRACLAHKSFPQELPLMSPVYVFILF